MTVRGKYNREEFYVVRKTPEDTDKLDLLSFRWLSFKERLKRRRLRVHIVEEHEVGRLWLISKRYYSRDDLDWILCIINDIIDPIGGMFIGQTLAIPPLEDIDSFYQSIVAQQRKSTIVRLNTTQV